MKAKEFIIEGDMLRRVLNKMGFGPGVPDQGTYQIFAQNASKDLDDTIKVLRTNNPNIDDASLLKGLSNWFAKTYGEIHPDFKPQFDAALSNVIAGMRQDNFKPGPNYNAAKKAYIKTLYRQQLDSQTKLKSAGMLDEPQKAAKKPRTGGRRAGYLSTSPSAVRRRARTAQTSAAAGTGQPFTFGGERYTKGPTGWVDSKGKAADAATAQILDRAATQATATKPRVRPIPGTNAYPPVTESLIVKKYMKMYEKSI